jgi:pyrimidine operon attenuation protein / uracil phosphoribosyltransferase
VIQTLDVSATLEKMALQLQDLLVASNRTNVAMIGIRTGGVWLANVLQQHLQIADPVGELDISFYRDDFTRMGLNPTVKPSSLPFPADGRHLVLVDDVIKSGRTIRAALNELFDFGRPASILLVTLLDVGGRELPIQPDVLGAKIELKTKQRVKLTGPEPLAVAIRD